MEKRKRNLLFYIGIFLFTLAIYLAFLYMKGYAPFTNKSLCTIDAHIQYIQLFSYYRNILLGKAGVATTLSKGIGGEGIGIISYYLASPFNLFVLAFKPSQMMTCYMVIYMIKMCLASTMCAVFIRHRFPKVKLWITALLSLAYAFSNYTIAQTYSILWIDGVYLLPLMFLGIHQAVAQRKPYLLGIVTGLDIIFNWYMGAINCLAGLFWCLLELLLLIDRKVSKKENLVSLGKGLGTYIFAEIAGVMIGLVLLLPTYLVMKTNARSSFKMKFLRNEWRASYVSLFKMYTIGTLSTARQTSLYAGSLPLLGTIGYFFSKKFSLSKRIIVFVILILSMLMYTHQIMYMIFSLLVNPESYWCRFGHIGCLMLIALSGFYFNEEEDGVPLLFISIPVSLIIAYANIHAGSFHRYAKITVLFMNAIALFYTLQQVKGKIKLPIKHLMTCGLILLTCSEFVLNMNGLYKTYKLRDSKAFEDYTNNGLAQINAIKSSEKQPIRISQTTGMVENRYNGTAYYNDSFLLNYHSLAFYVSTAASNTLDFLDHMGYHNNYDRLTVVNTSFLTTDSLFGVKYVLSPYGITGLTKTNLPVKNQRSVYLNAYAFPMAFTYNCKNGTYTNNTFTYQNDLFKRLTGIQKDLYTQVKAKLTKKDGHYIYTFDHLDAKTPYYGEFKTASSTGGFVTINKNFTIKYSGWNTPTVFNIPTSGTASVDYHDLRKPGLQKALFYSLNLDVLKEMKEAVTKRQASSLQISDQKISCTVNAKKDESLLITIPQDQNWKIKVNGKSVQSRSFDGALMSIPLQEGQNKIEMTPYIRGLIPGIGASVIGVLLLVFYAYSHRKHRQE